MTTLRPRDKGTVALHEGLALSVIGSAGSAGQVRRVDPVLGGLNYLESWTVADGALPQIGPYIGKQQFFITCTAGSIDATVGDAVLGAAQVSMDASGAASSLLDNLGKKVGVLSRVVDWGPLFAARMNAAIIEVNALGGGVVYVPPSPAGQPYVAEREIQNYNTTNVCIQLAAGVVIQRPAQFTLTGTTVSGSPQVTVSDTSNILADVPYVAAGPNAMYVGGTGVAKASRIKTVDSPTQFTLDKNATASGTVTLTFHYAHNVHQRYNAVNPGLICIGGWATLDGNFGAGLVTGDSADYLRNGVVTNACDGPFTSGIIYYNNYYHGEIGLAANKNVVFGAMRTKGNGFRGIHYHGGLLIGSGDNFNMGSIYMDGDGTVAKLFSPNSGARTNTGLHVMFENYKKVHIGSIIAQDLLGYSMDCAGRSENDGTGQVSNGITVDSLVTYDCYIGYNMSGGIRDLSLKSAMCHGQLLQAIGAQAPTLSVPVSNLGLLDGNGDPLVTCYGGTLTFPAGFDLTKIRTGHMCYIPVATGGARKLQVQTVNTVARTVVVIDDVNPSINLPWQAGDNATTKDVQFWTANFGAFISGDGSSPANNTLENISIGSHIGDTLMHSMLVVAAGGAGQYNARGLVVGSTVSNNCVKGTHVYNTDASYFGNISDRNTGTQYNGASLVVDSLNTGTYFGKNRQLTVGNLYSVSKGFGNFSKTNTMQCGFDVDNTDVTVLAACVDNTNSSGDALNINGTRVNVRNPRTLTGARMKGILSGVDCRFTFDTIEKPAISGFGTSPTLNATNGHEAFTVTVGSSPGSTGTVTLPAARVGWKVSVSNLTSNATLVCEKTSGTTTTAVVTSYARNGGAVTNFNAGDVLEISCAPY